MNFSPWEFLIDNECPNRDAARIFSTNDHVFLYSSVRDDKGTDSKATTPYKIQNQTVVVFIKRL